MTTDTAGHEMALAQAEAMIERQTDELARLRAEVKSYQETLCREYDKREAGDNEIIRLRDENAKLREDQDESDALRSKLAGILTRTANALKGEPGKLRSHGWHDLPEWAQRLRDENANLTYDLADLRVELAKRDAEIDLLKGMLLEMEMTDAQG